MFFHKSWLFTSANRIFWLHNQSFTFCSNPFWVNISSILFTLHAVSLHLIFITSVCKSLNYFYCCVFVLKSWFIRSTNNTVLFFSEYFICHFYFLWPKIMGKIFTPKTIRCFESFSNVYRFISDCVFFIFCNLVKCFWQSILNTLILLSDLI